MSCEFLHHRTAGPRRLSHSLKPNRLVSRLRYLGPGQFQGCLSPAGFPVAGLFLPGRQPWQSADPESDFRRGRWGAAASLPAPQSAVWRVPLRQDISANAALLARRCCRSMCLVAG